MPTVDRQRYGYRPCAECGSALRADVTSRQGKPSVTQNNCNGAHLIENNTIMLILFSEYLRISIPLMVSYAGIASRHGIPRGQVFFHLSEGIARRVAGKRCPARRTFRVPQNPYAFEKFK